MSKVKFSEQQQRALNCNSKNYIVSASAGSGKTAVLTERVYRLIAENHIKSMSELLVLTFTNAAAAEMRDRARKKLIEEGFYEKANEIDSANIQTFDAYALTLVKKYHYLLGLSKNVSLVDDSVFEIIQIKLLNEIIDKRIKEKDPNITLIYKSLVLRDDSNVFKFIKQIVKSASESRLSKAEFYNNYCNHFEEDSLIDESTDSYIQAFRKIIDTSYEIAKLLEDTTDADNILEYLDNLSACQTFDEFHNFYSDQSLSAFPRKPKNSDALQRTVIKKSLDVFGPIFEANTVRSIKTDFQENKVLVKALLSVAKELDGKVEEFKKETASYNFADIAGFANKLLDNDEIRESIKNQFKYIMVDEYQDTNDLQDNFINKISNNNVYVVGDVKQSIYGFRKANCELFLNKLNAYGDSTSTVGERIDLSNNYRSRCQVIDSNNKIFNEIMLRSETGLDYKAEHQMICGNNVFKENETIGQNYSHEVISYTLPKEPKKYQKAEYEAMVIASDIINKINKGIKVYDSDLKKQRNIEPRDFAILTYAKTSYSLYQKVFNEFQVPLHAIYNQSISDNDITRIVSNLLSLITLEKSENFGDEYVHKYISIARSFLYDLKDREEAIERIGSNKEFEIVDIKNKLIELSKLVDCCSLSQIVTAAYEIFDVESKLYRIGNVRESLSLLEYFVKTAKTLELMGYNLLDYVSYLKDVDKYEIDVSISPSENAANSVQLMTIHNSKGLQYKYIYCPQLYKKIDRSTLGKMFVDEKYGVVVPNYKKHPNGWSFFYELKKNQNKKEEILEKLRLFYVELTRAEEKVIFISQAEEEPKIPETLFSCNNFQHLLNYSKVSFDTYEGLITKDRINVPTYKNKLTPYNILEPNRMSDEFIKHIRASKGEEEDMNTELLELGNKYHHYLELVDFKTKDISFIKNEKDRERIERFLLLDIFKNSSEAKALHEYQFYDEVNDIYGFIDLMLVYDDHIDIIDYKLSNVDDEAYERQVGIYSDYIKRVSKEETHTYVLGILSNKIKQVS